MIKLFLVLPLLTLLFTPTDVSNACMTGEQMPVSIDELNVNVGSDEEPTYVNKITFGEGKDSYQVWDDDGVVTATLYVQAIIRGGAPKEDLAKYNESLTTALTKIKDSYMSYGDGFFANDFLKRDACFSVSGAAATALKSSPLTLDALKKFREQASGALGVIAADGEMSYVTHDSKGEEIERMNMLDVNSVADWRTPIEGDNDYSGQTYRGCGASGFTIKGSGTTQDGPAGSNVH